MSDTARLMPRAEAVRQLWDLLDGALSPEDQAKVEQHLVYSRRCCGELEFARELQTFLRASAVEELSPQLRERLEQILVLGSDAAWAGCIAGALSERVLINKMHRVGFDAIRISDRVPFSIDQAGLYPLFTSQIIELLRELLPPERHQRIGTSMLATAAKPTQ